MQSVHEFEMLYICRVGQNRIAAPYMTACTIISLPKIPCMHRKYIFMCSFGHPYAYGSDSGSVYIYGFALIYV
jgi:hypothetical protein